MSSSQRFLHAFLLPALLVRGLMVPGYMPGGEDGPLQLCPQGLPAAAVAVLFQHVDHDHARSGAPGDPEEGRTGGAMERCPLGGSLAQSAVPAAEFAIAVLHPAQFTTGLLDRLLPRAAERTHRARAPPLSREITDS